MSRKASTASNRRIRVMISSRCRDEIELGGKRASLTELRRKIKESIINIAPFGSPLFECWINEDSPAVDGTTDSWESCLKQARNSDILLLLYNGNPGWTAPTAPEGIGICHAELQTGISSGAAKVFSIELPLCDVPKNEVSRYERFREFYSKQNFFCSKTINGDEVLRIIPATLHEAVTELVALGGRETRKGRFDTGDALDWSRLDFNARKARIEQIVQDAIEYRKGSYVDSGSLYVRIANSKILCLIHAIPAPLSNSTAREMVDRPFHRDHLVAAGLKQKIGGPLHLFGCHRGVTERQAADLLGQPDVGTVDTAFGILAFDRASKVQCLFLRNCRDETTTRYAVQRAFEWLEKTGEDVLLAKRAMARARIVKTIAEENRI